ncbi:hypothetical protein HZC07_04205 [Candidatus Micrarchaeota archaeon]|nr:hypothetical protein [Candidatus Micrarchaeota archaeon]
MRLMLFFKLAILSLCSSLIAFGLLSVGAVDSLKIFAIGIVLSIAITAFYPDLRGVKQGDLVSVVADSAVPSLIGRIGRAAQSGKKNQQIKIKFDNGAEVLGVVESYTGLISPPRIKLIYEEKIME